MSFHSQTKASRDVGTVMAPVLKHTELLPVWAWWSSQGTHCPDEICWSISPLIACFQATLCQCAGWPSTLGTSGLPEDYLLLTALQPLPVWYGGTRPQQKSNIYHGVLTPMQDSISTPTAPSLCRLGLASH